MPGAYRLGIAGLVHDHVWQELQHWNSTGRVEFVAVADPNPPLIERAVREFQIPQTFDDPRRMLEECELDVLQICTSNAAAGPIVEFAAERGVHTVVEKPLAATLEQADRMLSATEKAGTMLFINWPNRWRTPTKQAWDLVKAGEIGDLFSARMRMAHKGPREFGCSDYFCDWLYDPLQNGGGALVDYCSYGAVAFRYLFGMPNAVQAVAARLVKHDITVEDNAAMTLLYHDKFAFAEASWSQIPSYHDAVYLGTTGTLWTEDGHIRVSHSDGNKREIQVQELPDTEHDGPTCFLSCLEQGLQPPDVCSAQVCRDAQEILQAGLFAADSGTRVLLPLDT